MSNQPDASAQQQQPPEEDGKDKSATLPSFEEWIASQDETVKTVINTRFLALQNTVKSTRDERDTLKGQLKALSAKAEKGSELEKQLNEFTAKLDAAERKSDFMEQAIKPEIGCRNPTVAFALATVNNLFTSRGAPDWSAIKAMAPELFGTPLPKARGGDGTGGSGDVGKQNMNALIRQRAGRG